MPLFLIVGSENSKNCRYNGHCIDSFLFFDPFKPTGFYRWFLPTVFTGGFYQRFLPVIFTNG
jgi:hypothetical protein